MKENIGGKERSERKKISNMGEKKKTSQLKRIKGVKKENRQKRSERESKRERRKKREMERGKIHLGRAITSLSSAISTIKGFTTGARF